MQNLASRRAVVTALAASMAALASPCVKAQAQSPRTARVGWLMFTSSGRYADLTARGYVKGLAEGGYVEGRNLTFEKRSAEGDPHKLRGLARELVAAKVDEEQALNCKALRAEFRDAWDRAVDSGQFQDVEEQLGAMERDVNAKCGKM